jgi:hypothetical protein
LLEDRLNFAIIPSTTEGRHGTHILSGAMSMARRQAAKAYKAEAKVQHELLANEKRSANIQRNEQMAGVVIAEYCKGINKKGKSWQDTLYSKTMLQALIHLSGIVYKSTLKKAELAELLAPFLADASTAICIVATEEEEVFVTPVTNTTRSGRTMTQNPRFA